MKKNWVIFTALAAFVSFGQLSAGVIYFGPSVTFTAQQPVQAIIVDGNGNTIEKTYSYDPAMGGIDLGIDGGPSTSIYFPGSNVRYLWSNGCWVDEDGYYWNHGTRVYVNNPEWKNNWGVYWNTHWHNSWHDHWDRHHEDAGWRYRTVEHWHHDGHDHWRR